MKLKHIILAALLAVAIVATATVASAQVSSTVENTYCYPSLVECNPIVFQNLVDPTGSFLLVFPAGTSPSNQGSFAMYESSGTPAVPTNFMASKNCAGAVSPCVTVAWGYAVGAFYSASFLDPAGRALRLVFKQVTSTRYGLVWAIVGATSTIDGPSLLVK